MRLINHWNFFIVSVQFGHLSLLRMGMLEFWSSIIMVTWNFCCKCLNAWHVLVGWRKFEIRLRVLFFKETFLSECLFYLLIFNSFSVHDFNLLIAVLLKSFQHLNLELKIFNLFVFQSDLVKQFYLLNFHKLDLFDIMGEPPFIFIELYFLLVLMKFVIHFAKFLLYFGHVVFIGYDELSLLSFQQSVYFSFQVISEWT